MPGLGLMMLLSSPLPRWMHLPNDIPYRSVLPAREGRTSSIVDPPLSNREDFSFNVLDRRHPPFPIYSSSPLKQNPR